MTKLTHIDEQGKARMVDVSGKEVTRRVAAAMGLLVASLWFSLTAFADAPPPQFAYVTNRFLPSLAQFRVTADGTLLPLSPPTVALGMGSLPSAVAVSRTGRFVYTANRNRDTVSQFRAAADGTLTLLTAADIPTGHTPEAIVFHPKGKFVYVVCQQQIFQYQVAVNGRFQPLSPATVDCPDETKQLVLGPQGKFAYAVRPSGIQQYKVMPNGALFPIPGEPVTGGFPSNLVVSPQGFAYLACEEGVFQYKVSTAGTLMPLSPAIIPCENLPQAIAMDPKGHRVYVISRVNNANGTVAQYAVGAGGGLTRTTDVLLATGKWPTKTEIDPSGRFLYVTHLGDFTVSRFALASDGSLTQLTPLPNIPIVSFALARHSLSFSPAALEARATNTAVVSSLLSEDQRLLAQHPEFVYVVNKSSDTISQFQVQANGTLAALGALKTGSQPMSIALDPKGRFAYVACAGNQHIWQYQILPDGHLASLIPPTIYSGNLPFSITVTPNSKFVYAVNYLDASISQFRVGDDGALIAVGDPVKTDPRPQVITADPEGRFIYTLCTENDVLSCFEIGADGTLTLNKFSFSIRGGIPSVPTFSARGFAYISTTNQAIWQERVGPTGTLVPLSQEQIHVEKQLAQPAALAADPTGKFLYSSNWPDNSLSSYRIGEDGALSPLSLPSVPTGASPGPLVADPSGHFLYVMNVDDRAIAQYRITSTGALTLLTPAQVPAGILPVLADPNAIVIIRR